MKRWECVQVDHHKNIGATIERYQNDDWHLHTYQACGTDLFFNSVKHYLLFEKFELSEKLEKDEGNLQTSSIGSGNYPCPYCQNTVNSLAKYCPSCGKDLYYPGDS